MLSSWDEFLDIGYSGNVHSGLLHYIWNIFNFFLYKYSFCRYMGIPSPSVTVLLIWCSSSSENVVHISSVVLSQFIIALTQSCLFSYYSSLDENLHQLSCSAFCLHLTSLLHICALLQFSHFTSKANWHTLIISFLNLVSKRMVLFCHAILLNLPHE